MSEFPDYLTVDYTDGEGESPDEYPSIEHKIKKALEVVETGLREYENPAVMWTGGKDSTLTLYFVKEVVEQYDELEMPATVFIDHFQHFDELIEFAERWADRWDVELMYARNDDVGSYVDEHGLEPGDNIPVENLSEHNQHHIRNILEYEEDTFPFLLDTYVGNHLLKTVALNDTLESEGIDGIISGIRWDDRVQPILQFMEADVWDAFWYFVVPETVDAYPDDGYVPQGFDDLPNDLTHEDIPVSPKYFAGFRSLGSEISTDKSAEEPAWLQDMANTTERAGRAQDKEDLMQRLRDLGYM
ncbi:nodulation protein [Halobacteriales archaeon QS_9_67_17]|nr:MAG: nodulation protein [Halobacteriales archaeon QS_9_67_17]